MAKDPLGQLQRQRQSQFQLSFDAGSAGGSGLCNHPRTVSPEGAESLPRILEAGRAGYAGVQKLPALAEVRGDPPDPSTSVIMQTAQYRCGHCLNNLSISSEAPL